MTGREGGRGIAPLIVNFGIGKGGQHHIPAALHPRKSHGARFTGGWVGPKAGLNGCEEKILCKQDSRLK